MFFFKVLFLFDGEFATQQRRNSALRKTRTLDAT